MLPEVVQGGRHVDLIRVRRSRSKIPEHSVVLQMPHVAHAFQACGFWRLLSRQIVVLSRCGMPVCLSAPADSPLQNRGAFRILPPEPGVVLWVPQIMRARKFYLCLLTATLTASPLWNGLTDEPHPRLAHKSWNVHDDLPDNRIKDIIQTRDGYLWLATRGGLARFDGV